MNRKLTALLTIIALALAGCGVNQNPLGSAEPSGSAPAETIVVGSANFSESEIIAELYAGALNAKGITATTKTRIGSREVYLQALKDGSISVVPEYTGNLLQFVDPQNPARSPEDIEKALPDAVGPDLKVLDPSEAANQDVYVMLKTTADENGIKTLRDLGAKASGWVLGGPSELAGRPYGPKGLESVYNVKFKEFKPYNSQAVKIKDLSDGKIHVASFFTTDVALTDSKFLQLADPEMMILPQNLIPLVRSGVADNTTAKDAINAVQKLLTTQELTELNRQADTEHKNPKDIAAAWLKAKGLA